MHQFIAEAFSTMKISFFVFLFLAFKISLVDSGGLYLFEGKTDYVLELKGKDDLETRAKHSTFETWIVMFYSPYCGHCTHYAPIFSHIAKRNIEMYSDIKFGAVSCASYGSVCSENGVHGYPTVYAFNKKGEKKTIQNRGEKDLNSWIDKTHQSKEEEDTSKKDHSLHFFRQQINEDLLNNAENIGQTTVTQDTPIDFVGSYTIDSITSLGFAFDKEIPLSEISTKAEILEHLRMFFLMLRTLYPSVRLRNSFAFMFEELTKVSEADATSWVLDIRKWDALVQTWKRTLPGITSKGLVMEEEKTTNVYGIDHVKNDENQVHITSGTSNTEFSSSSMSYRWFGCGGDVNKGSEIRGFTCGMWYVFHILSVQTGSSKTEKFLSGKPPSFHSSESETPSLKYRLELQSIMKESKKNTINGIDRGEQFSIHAAQIFSDPALVLYVIKVYMKHFFGCELCKEHFLSVLSNCHFGSCVPGLVLSTIETNLVQDGDTLVEEEEINYDIITHELYETKSESKLYNYKKNYSLVIFLWKLHNFISFTNFCRNIEEGKWRLMDNLVEVDTSSNNDFVDLHSLSIEEQEKIYSLALWPATKQCPKCWQTNAFLKMAQFGLVNKEIHFDELLNEHSNLDEVYNYLMVVYGTKQESFDSQDSDVEPKYGDAKENVGGETDEDIVMLPVFIMCFGTMFLWVVGRWYYLKSTGRQKKHDKPSIDETNFNDRRPQKLNGMKNDQYWA